MRNELPIVLATNRPLAQHLFLTLRQRDAHPLKISHIPVDVNVLPAHWGCLAAATVVAVDVAPDPLAAIKVCQELRAQLPTLPIVALVCCPRMISPVHFQALIAAGVGSVLDSHSTPEQIVDALQRAAGGDTVMQLRMDRGNGGFLMDALGSQKRNGEALARPRLGQLDTRLLELVTHGLSDCEIGQRLCLSPHTVKHHIERLRTEVGARNRTELAKWAGLSGFYRR